ncbi:phage tail protein I [Cupriavidus nantongensis]|uniref:Phage tail protein n=1 Tax=Cupriavidus nantongensis TaxID=1796606 RepID=A0A142JGT9_9BURK|nr:phage tail protein I [Cupriavidus nantongensis]AMR77301.1 hypothetical protein A2G96_05895 [Cupriavidus nantongensis]
MSERVASLLPPNATPLERAIEQVTVTEPDPGILRLLYQPHAIPFRLLPWLAWAEDVPIWPKRDNAAADEAIKRDLVANSWRLHRLQGTLAGLRRMAHYAGARIVGVFTPPSKNFLAPALTNAERAAFRALYPQLRIYRYRTIGQRQGAMLHGAHLGHGVFPLISDAIARIAPRAYLYRDGVESELAILQRSSTTSTRTAITEVEVRAPGVRRHVSFIAGHPRYLATSDARQRIYNLQLADAYQQTDDALSYTTITPSLTPIDVRFDNVAEIGHARGVFLGAAQLGQSYRVLALSTARDRLYQRLAVFDPDIEVSRVRAALHFGGQHRLGFPAHNAELRVEIRGRRTLRHAGRFVVGHTVTSDQRPLSEALAAMRWAKRLSDRIAIDTAIRRPEAAGAHLVAGDVIAGEWNER